VHMGARYHLPTSSRRASATDILEPRYATRLSAGVQVSSRCLLKARMKCAQFLSSTLWSVSSALLIFPYGVNSWCVHMLTHARPTSPSTAALDMHLLKSACCVGGSDFKTCWSVGLRGAFMYSSRKLV
jgi:hypothetical protein